MRHLTFAISLLACLPQAPLFAAEKTPTVQNASWPDTAIAEALVDRGDALYLKKDLDGALSNYSSAIRRDPNLLGAYVGRGNVHYDKRDFDRALNDYDAAVLIDADYDESAML